MSFLVGLHGPFGSAKLSELAGGVFTTSRISEVLGVKPGCLKEWLKFIEPSIEKATGPGTRNLLSRTDIYKLFVFKRLLGAGFTREAAKAIVCKLEEQGLKYSSTILTGSTGTVRFGDDDDVLSHELSINIGKLKEEVDRLLQ